MTIHTLAVSQQQQYQYDQSVKRKITRLAPGAETAQSPQGRESERENVSTAAQSTSLSASLSRSISLSAARSTSLAALSANTPSISLPVKEAASNNNHTGNNTYKRPLSPEMGLIKLIIEGYFGEYLDLNKYDFDFSKIKEANSQQYLTGIGSTLNASSAMLTLDNQVFNENEQIKVEQFFSRSQSLSYQMQGEFIIDDKQLSLDYSFELTSEQIRYNSFETQAGNLKDPILVQFGNQSLGHIEGEQDFDINNDNTLDALPIFSGDVGYLVYDQNANGRADNGSELFGPNSGNGFGELALLDDNKNGFIDKNDTGFEQLYLWQPSGQGQPDGNGQVDEQGQWLSLADAGIAAINLDAISTPYAFYDEEDQIQAQLRQSSFAIGENGQGYGVHQIDVRI